MTKKLYVGNLAFQTTEDTLRQTFASCGEVAEVSLVLDRMTGRSRGFAFLAMASAEDAEKAVQQLNEQLVDGRPIRVSIAEDRPRGGGSSSGSGGGSGNGPRGFRSSR